MKGLQVLTAIAGVGLAGLGAAMAMTNPGQDAYEDYALKNLTVYLKDNVCAQAPKWLDNNFLQRQCTSLIDTGRPQIQRMITEGTHRQNFIFFSIYQTDLSPGSFLPAYHVETVGAFQHFYTYRAGKE